MLLGQAPIFAEILASHLFLRRSKNDVHTYSRIVAAQRIPSAAIALVGAAVSHQPRPFSELIIVCRLVMRLTSTLTATMSTSRSRQPPSSSTRGFLPSSQCGKLGTRRSWRSGRARCLRLSGAFLFMFFVNCNLFPLLARRPTSRGSSGRLCPRMMMSLLMLSLLLRLLPLPGRSRCFYFGFCMFLFMLFTLFL